MNINEFIRYLTPKGTDAWLVAALAKARDEDAPVRWGCPSWPADLFAITASIIDRSGCYTEASPDRNNLNNHAAHLKKVNKAAQAWNADPGKPPKKLVDHWDELINKHGDIEMEQVCNSPAAISILLTLFAVADETCAGMGWDVTGDGAGSGFFATITMGSMADKSLAELLMHHVPTSFCVAVPPDRAVVLPKSLTPSVGCTIRSLSHHVALLPPKTVIAPEWIWSTTERAADRHDPQLPYDVRLLLVPFPYTVDGNCFRLSFPRTGFGGGGYKMAAYFRLEQLWLKHKDARITGEQLADELIIPLVKRAYTHSGQMPDGIVLPECALTSEIAMELVAALEAREIKIEFLITGVLDVDTKTKASYNRAQIFVLRKGEGAVKREQNKHHRWRLDRSQTEGYALDFDDDDDNEQWWEDIDVGKRQLPFFGLRKDMSVTTLICEDLARADPAMSVIRAVGPNLVIALLMDGPQLETRWPGRYATVLADDPGSAVLSFTCSAMVDRSNWRQARPARIIGLWRDASGRTQEIPLPQDSLGVLLTLESVKKHQTTLDNRSDNEVARQLKLRHMLPLFLDKKPIWI